MVSAELGACEWFVWDLRRSNLIDRGQLDEVVGEFLQANPRAEPPALAEYLIGKKFLTQFQAERLLQGKTQGFVLGPFTLMDALGAGSMGTVYKALNKNDNQWYAVKVLPRRSMWNVRIARRKVRAFEQCRHPAVTPFVDVGTSGGMHYLAWPYVEGEALDKLVERQGALSPELTAWIALQVAEGLDVCQQASLFHGMLKPSNVMLGTDQQVHILDCGIGCLLAETEGESLVDTMSTANAVASGLDCSSPESIMDPTNLTPSGDQYSLGCVLYYCLTGRVPFPDGSAAEKMMAHQFKQPTPVRDLNANVPAELCAVVERLMQKAPEGRYGTASEVVEALKPLAQRGMSIPAPTAVPVRAVAPAPSQPPVAEAAPVPSRPAVAESKAAPVLAKAAAASPPGHQRSAPAALPSRQSLRGTPTVASTPASPKAVAKPTAAPQTSVAGERPTNRWQEHLETIGIVLLTGGVCALAWYLTTFWF
jgi:serine/threonine protein kinase